MPLMKCPDCGKEMSTAAPACPNCGRPNVAASQPAPPKPSAATVHGKGEGCFLRTMNIGCVIVVGFIVLIIVLIEIGSSGSTVSPSSTSSAPSSPNSSEPKLELVRYTWSKGDDYAIVKGQVKNISSQSIRNVEAVATFYDKSGGFVTSDDALIDYNPILAGQTSPFSVMARVNPEMRTATVEFKELMGGTIPHISREK